MPLERHLQIFLPHYLLIKSHNMKKSTYFFSHSLQNQGIFLIEFVDRRPSNKNYPCRNSARLSYIWKVSNFVWLTFPSVLLKSSKWYWRALCEKDDILKNVFFITFIRTKNNDNDFIRWHKKETRLSNFVIKHYLHLWNGRASGAVGNNPCEDIPFLKVAHTDAAILLIARTWRLILRRYFR